jgi:hypothetical protein
MSNKGKRKMMRNAAKAPNWVRHVAAIKVTPAERQAHKNRKLGTFGAASEVRIIDPKDYDK